MRRVNNLPWLAVGLSRFLQITTAQVDPNDPDHGVRWVYPPRSEEFTFHYMDTVEVEWTSFFDEPILYTFCMSDDDIIMGELIMSMDGMELKRRQASKSGLRSRDNDTYLLAAATCSSHPTLSTKREEMRLIVN